MLLESIYLSDVIVGMIIFLIWKEYCEKLKKRSEVVKLAFAIISICLAYILGNLFARENGTIGLVSSIMLMLANILLVMGVLLSGFLQKALENSVVRLLGTASFEIFLLHWIVICSISSYLWLESADSEHQFIIRWIIFVLTIIIVYTASIVLKKYVTPYLLKPIENRILCYITK